MSKNLANTFFDAPIVERGIIITSFKMIGYGSIRDQDYVGFYGALDDVSTLVHPDARLAVTVKLDFTAENGSSKKRIRSHLVWDTKNKEVFAIDCSHEPRGNFKFPVKIYQIKDKNIKDYAEKVCLKRHKSWINKFKARTERKAV